MQKALAAASLNSVQRLLGHRLALAPVPLLTLAMLWPGQQLWLTLVVCALQVGWLALVLGQSARQTPLAPLGYPRATGIDAVERLLPPHVPGESQSQRPVALVIRLDDAESHTARHGTRYVEAMMHELGLRLGRALRDRDAYCRLSGGGFGIALIPQRDIEINAVLSVAHRVQSHLAQAFSFEAVTVWPTVSVGFCLSARAAELNGIGMLDAAAQAAERALLAGPNGLYSYSAVDLPSRLSGERQAELRRALETGEIRAYFQPQLCTRTGHVSGFEALARWEHPDEGLVPPARFLPGLEAAGLTPRLAERMLRDALALLKQLDALGHVVPTVSINLAGPELRNPSLADEIAWELDRHDLPPNRLVVEILETVIADSDDDIMVRNIARLAEMGCGIDLDDFGTGHAAIASIRRFAVGRLKIDRSFITHLHQDRDRQKMVAAILSMARQLDLGTVAEGVESDAELALLAELGCDHAQGFVIARPMPGADLPGWLRRNAALLGHQAPPVGAPVP